MREPGEPNQPVTVSRRAFVGGAGAAALGFAPLLRMLPPATVAAAFAERPPLQFFDEHQAAVVVEATARLIPGPTDDPAETSGGAREAGVVHYVDRFLSAFDEDPPRIYTGGPWSDRHGGATNEFARFVSLAPWEAQRWRERVGALAEAYRVGVAELDAAAGGDFTAVSNEARDAILAADTPSQFRRVLFEHAVEGTYAVPEYGGNADLVGWSDIGYAGDVAPEGWPASEVRGSDGPDPLPEGFRLPFSAGAVEATPGAQITTDAQPASVTAGLATPDAVLAAAMPGLARWRVRPGRTGGQT